MDQIDPWQAIPRQVFTPYDCLLISVAFVVFCHVGCLWVTGVCSSRVLSVHVCVNKQHGDSVLYEFFRFACIVSSFQIQSNLSSRVILFRSPVFSS